MQKLSKDAEIKCCHDCSRIDIIKGYVCLETYKHILNPHGEIPKDCPLQDCKVFNVSGQKTPSVDTLQWLLQNIYDSEGKPVDKIIVVRQKSSHGKE